MKYAIKLMMGRSKDIIVKGFRFDTYEQAESWAKWNYSKPSDTSPLKELPSHIKVITVDE